MNDLIKLMNCIVEEINPQNNIELAKNKVYKNETFSTIMHNNGISNKAKNKIYIFIIELIRYDNKKIVKKSKGISDNVSSIFFQYILKTHTKNVKHFSALFLNYLMYNKIQKIKDLEKCLSLISKLDKHYFDFIPRVYRYDKLCFDEKYGKILKDNGFAKNIYNFSDLEYELSPLGDTLFNNIFLDMTQKEISYYSQIIDLKSMEDVMTAREHKLYYDGVMKNVRCDNPYVKKVRLHEGIFKDFLEEYSVLIKYTITKYGENFRMSFCGRKIHMKIKCDGIVFNEGIQEKIEITYPLFDKKVKYDMKQLNNYGYTVGKAIYRDTYIDKVREKVKQIINEKNNSESCDESVRLVIYVDMFDFLFDGRISNLEYYDELFGDLKKKVYKFKSVELLIDKNDGISQPWIYQIK